MNQSHDIYAIQIHIYAYVHCTNMVYIYGYGTQLTGIQITSQKMLQIFSFKCMEYSLKTSHIRTTECIPIVIYLHIGI